MNLTNITIYFFYALLVLNLLVLSYGEYRYNKIKDEKTSGINERKRFRLRWISIPLLLYSIIVIILHYSVILLSSFVASVSSILVVPFLLIIFPLVPVYLKYGRKAMKDPTFFK